MKSLSIVFAFILLTSFTPEDTCKVTLIRSGIYSGSAGPVKIFMDDKLICEIRNNSYSVHDIPTGVHRFSAQFYGKKSKENTEESALEIDLSSGKNYYLQLSLTKRLNVSEVTENSWKGIKDELKEDDCH